MRYDAVIDIEGGPETHARIGPDAFMVIEQWESRDAVQAHAASAHVAEYAERRERTKLMDTIAVLLKALIESLFMKDGVLLHEKHEYMEWRNSARTGTSTDGSFITCSPVSFYALRSI